MITSTSASRSAGCRAPHAAEQAIGPRARRACAGPRRGRTAGRGRSRPRAPRQHAAEPDHDHRPEELVLGDADDHLDPASTPPSICSQTSTPSSRPFAPTARRARRVEVVERGAHVGGRRRTPTRTSPRSLLWASAGATPSSPPADRASRRASCGAHRLGGCGAEDVARGADAVRPQQLLRRRARRAPRRGPRSARMRRGRGAPTVDGRRVAPVNGERYRARELPVVDVGADAPTQLPNVRKTGRPPSSRRR